MIDSIDGLKVGVDHGAIGVESRGCLVIVEVVGAGHPNGEHEVPQGVEVADLSAEDQTHVGQGDSESACIFAGSVIVRQAVVVLGT